MRFPKHSAVVLCMLPISSLFAGMFPFDSVLARGDSCLAVIWMPDSINTNSAWYIQNGSLCTGSDTVYLHCDFKPGVTYRSIAYSYGGEDPHATFRDKLAKGFLVGSHQCHYQSFGDPSPAVAGADCSGFVCYVWDIPRTNTHGLLSDTSFLKIPISMLMPGDILVKAGSHAALVVEKDDSTHVLIWESTSAVNGCRERVIDITEPAWASYVAVRNPAITTTMSIRLSSRPLRSPRLSAVPELKKGRLCFRFEQPFAGIFMLYDFSGKRICRMTIDNPSTHCTWASPAAVPNGIYCIVLSAANGFHETFVCTAVR